MKLHWILAALALAVPVLGSGDDDHAHPWEWAATFEMPTDKPATWIFQTVEGEYADPAMKLCWLEIDSNDEEGLEKVEEMAEDCYNQTAQTVTAGANLLMNTLYDLEFDSNAFATTFTVGPLPASNPNAAFFLEHFPYEFEENVHWLQSFQGEDLEPGFEEPASDEEGPGDKGMAYVASLLVAIVSFSGVLLANGVIVKAFGGVSRYTNTASAFASGVLLYAAFSLLLPEGLYLLGSKDEDGEAYTENQINAFYASSVVIGVVLCVVLDVAFGHSSTAEGKILENEDAGDEEEKEVSKAAFFDFSNVQPVCWMIVVGDFFHNFVDGIVIGAAFMSCEEGAGWTVTASTIMHEISQEVADFMVLTSEGKMTFAQAAFWNFVSSLGVFIGTLIVVQSEPSGPVQGCLMAFGASFYIYIALAQLQWWKVRTDLVRNSLMFVFGCIIIGLVLIAHEHCSPAGGDGHSHGHEH